MDQLTPSTVSPSSKPTRPTDRHAVVIGAGFGGLAAAIRLGARGYRVTVLDKLNAPGGRASAFRQDGFTFDPGPTILTAPHLFEELWALCGRSMADDVTLKLMQPFYRIRFHDGSTFDASGDPEAMRAEVARLSPSDVAGYERFMRHSQETCRIGFEELGDHPFNSIMDMLKVAPDIIRLGGYRSVHATVSKFIKDERLRIAFGFHPLFIGGNPFAVSSVYTMVPYFERQWGVHFPIGGTGAMVTGLASLIEGQGNTIRCNTEVEQILVSNGRATGVRLASGETIAADIVVSNADSAWTYRKMLPPEARKTWTDRKLDRARYSMGLFIWYFGTDRQYPDVPHHTIALGPRYKGLLHDIFNRKVLAKDFSLYLHRPTATDPALAPAGCDTFYVLSPVPNLDGKTDWTKEAEPYRQAIQKRLEETLLPGLGKHVVTSKVRTPIDFRDGLLALHGAAFSLEPVLLQSAYWRPHNKSEDVAGLYLVGAGTHPGAGVPAVISSAKVLDRVVPHAATL
ncbi:phytoene desaturase [Rhodopila globiformis]|uniref:Phytoene desaturase (neurosporene-forming) n=1 Tax=Rhodopila globiformis TaxID=1071 RepID=A0A2S6MXQ3_RHOGL|nr:phytoene dehydrogenase [Rhodopila globiformis]